MSKHSSAQDDSPREIEEHGESDVDEGESSAHLAQTSPTDGGEKAASSEEEHHPDEENHSEDEEHHGEEHDESMQSETEAADVSREAEDHSEEETHEHDAYDEENASQHDSAGEEEHHGDHEDHDEHTSAHDDHEEQGIDDHEDHDHEDHDVDEHDHEERAPDDNGSHDVESVTPNHATQRDHSVNEYHQHDLDNSHDVEAHADEVHEEEHADDHHVDDPMHDVETEKQLGNSQAQNINTVGGERISGYGLTENEESDEETSEEASSEYEEESDEYDEEEQNQEEHHEEHPDEPTRESAAEVSETFHPEPFMKHDRRPEDKPKHPIHPPTTQKKTEDVVGLVAKKKRSANEKVRSKDTAGKPRKKKADDSGPKKKKADDGAPKKRKHRKHSDDEKHPKASKEKKHKAPSPSPKAGDRKSIPAERKSVQSPPKDRKSLIPARKSLAKNPQSLARKSSPDLGLRKNNPKVRQAATRDDDSNRRSASPSRKSLPNTDRKSVPRSSIPTDRRRPSTANQKRPSIADQRRPSTGHGRQPSTDGRKSSTSRRKSVSPDPASSARRKSQTAEQFPVGESMNAVGGGSRKSLQPTRPARNSMPVRPRGSMPGAQEGVSISHVDKSGEVRTTHVTLASDPGIERGQIQSVTQVVTEERVVREERVIMEDGVVVETQIMDTPDASNQKLTSDREDQWILSEKKVSLKEGELPEQLVILEKQETQDTPDQHPEQADEHQEDTDHADQHDPERSNEHHDEQQYPPEEKDPPPEKRNRQGVPVDNDGEKRPPHGSFFGNDSATTTTREVPKRMIDRGTATGLMLTAIGIKNSLGGMEDTELHALQDRAMEMFAQNHEISIEEVSSFVEKHSTPTDREALQNFLAVFLKSTGLDKSNVPFLPFSSKNGGDGPNVVRDSTGNYTGGSAVTTGVNGAVTDVAGTNIIPNTTSNNVTMFSGVPTATAGDESNPGTEPKPVVSSVAETSTKLGQRYSKAQQLIMNNLYATQAILQGRTDFEFPDQRSLKETSKPDSKFRNNSNNTGPTDLRYPNTMQMSRRTETATKEQSYLNIAAEQRNVNRVKARLAAESGKEFVENDDPSRGGIPISWVLDSNYQEKATQAYAKYLASKYTTEQLSKMATRYVACDIPDPFVRNHQQQKPRGFPTVYADETTNRNALSSYSFIAPSYYDRNAAPGSAKSKDESSPRSAGSKDGRSKGSSPLSVRGLTTENQDNGRKFEFDESLPYSLRGKQPVHIKPARVDIDHITNFIQEIKIPTTLSRGKNTSTMGKEKLLDVPFLDLNHPMLLLPDPPKHYFRQLEDEKHQMIAKKLKEKEDAEARLLTEYRKYVKSLRRFPLGNIRRQDEEKLLSYETDVYGRRSISMKKLHETSSDWRGMMHAEKSPPPLDVSSYGGVSADGSRLPVSFGSPYHKDSLFDVTSLQEHHQKRRTILSPSRTSLSPSSPARGPVGDMFLKPYRHGGMYRGDTEPAIPRIGKWTIDFREDALDAEGNAIPWFPVSGERQYHFDSATTAAMKGRMSASPVTLRSPRHSRPLESFGRRMKLTELQEDYKQKQQDYENLRRQLYAKPEPAEPIEPEMVTVEDEEAVPQAEDDAMPEE